MTLLAGPGAIWQNFRRDEFRDLQPLVPPGADACGGPALNPCPPWRQTALLATLACLLQTALYFSAWGPGAGNLADPDGYMRLVRVGQLIEGGAWADQRIPRSNPPAGEELHWSRPLDVLLIAGALPLVPWMGWKEALFTWGVALSPVLMAGAGMILATGLARTSETRLFAATLFFCQAAVIQQCAAGRPDHHSLLLLCSAWAFTEVRRVLRPGTRPQAALRLGLACGLGCWTSLEFMPITILVITALAWDALGRPAPGAARQAVFAATVAGLGAWAAWSEGRGPRPAADAWSSAHALGTGLYAAGAGLYAWMARRSCLHPRRFLLLSACLIPAAAYGLAFHRFLLPDPYSPVAGILREAWLDQIAEILPVQDQAHPRHVGWLIWFYAPIASAAWAVVHALRTRRTRALVPHCFCGWWVMASLGVLAWLSAGDFRWTMHAAVPGTWITLHAGLAIKRHIAHLHLRPLWTGRARLALVALLAAGYLPLSPLARYSPFTPQAAAASTGPAVQAGGEAGMAAAVHALRSTDLKPGSLVLAAVNDGPEILYRTPHRVLATPYHRNLEGVGTARRLMSDLPVEQALAALRERGVDCILWRGDGGGRIFWSTKARPDSLFHALESGHVPDGLVPAASTDGRTFLWKVLP